MDKVKLLTQRLNEIAASIEQHPKGLGLLGLGSVGIEQSRMDEYSDLDFFAIVAKGSKERFLGQLNWLSDISEVAWFFRNTLDGYKLLFADGVFCEFAVFEPQELAHIPYSEGKFLWRDPKLDENLAKPVLSIFNKPDSETFLVGELLTNLYVGLCRYHRGEKASAFRFVQVYALDRLISLLDLTGSSVDEVFIDCFCLDRRVEQRHPTREELLLSCMAGAHKTQESAQNMLEFIVQHYDVNRVLEKEIRCLF